MPTIQQINTIDITPEKFLRACDGLELYELDLLIGRRLAEVERKVESSLPDLTEKMSLKEVLQHCLEFGVYAGGGISFDVQARIKHFINMEEII